MRRRDFFPVAGGVAVAFVLGQVPVKGSDGPKGAIKATLYAADSSGNAAGWVVLNTTGTHELIAQVHLQQGVPNTVYDVAVAVNGVVFNDVGELTTNRNGRGNEHVTLSVVDYAGSNDTDIDVQVYLSDF